MDLGQYYLVGAGYVNVTGFLAPYQGVKHHLREFTNNPPRKPKELFNMKHSQACNVIERAFGIFKGRIGILRTSPRYDIKDQVSIVMACCVLRNLISLQGDQVYDEELMESLEHAEEDGIGGLGDLPPTSSSHAM